MLGLGTLGELAQPARLGLGVRARSPNKFIFPGTSPSLIQILDAPMALPNRKRGRGPRNRFKAKKQSTAAKALALAKANRKKLPRPEWKFNYSNLSSGTLFSNAGWIVDLTSIPQGDAGTNRDGLEVILRQIHISTRVSFKPAGSVVPVTCRFMVFRWEDDNFPTMTDIFRSITEVQSALSIEKMREQKLWVLYDKMFHLDDVASTQRVIKKTFKFKHRVKYSGSGATSGLSGRVFFLGFSNVVVTGDIPNWVVEATTRFTEC